MLIHNKSFLRCQGCGSYFDDEFSYRGHLDKMHNYTCSRDYWMEKYFVRLPIDRRKATVVIRHTSIETTADGDVEVHRFRDGGEFVPAESVILGARNRKFFTPGMKEIYERGRAADRDTQSDDEADVPF